MLQRQKYSCEICSKDYRHEENQHRPVVLHCGHSVCLDCFHQLKTCPLCKQLNVSQFENPHKLKGSINYIVDQACTSDQAAMNQRDLENIKGAFYCFDCNLPYKPLQVSFVRDPHIKHNKIALEGKDLGSVSQVLWIQQHKTADVNETGLISDFFRASFYVIQKIVKEFTTISIADKENSKVEIDAALSMILKNGVESLTPPQKKLADSYMILKGLQERLYRPFLLAMREFGPPEISSAITSEVWALIERAETALVDPSVVIPPVGWGHFISIVDALDEVLPREEFPKFKEHLEWVSINLNESITSGKKSGRSSKQKSRRNWDSKNLFPELGKRKPSLE